MIDLNSAACIVRAAEVCVAAVLARIAADPDSPLVPDLQILADHAQAIIRDNGTTGGTP